MMMKGELSYCALVSLSWISRRSALPTTTYLSRQLYEKLDYSVNDLNEAVGCVDVGLSDDKVTLLMGRMREPSLSIHGVQGGSSDESSRTVIPGTVTGKFSLRYASMYSFLIP